MIIYSTFLILLLIMVLPLLVLWAYGYIYLKKRSLSLPFFKILGMVFRKTFDTDVIDSWAYVKRHSLEVDLEDIETHFLTGGKSMPLLRLLAKYSNKQDLSFKGLAMLQLANKDVEVTLKEQFGY